MGAGWRRKRGGPRHNRWQSLARDTSRASSARGSKLSRYGTLQHPPGEVIELRDNLAPHGKLKHWPVWITVWVYGFFSARFIRYDVEVTYSPVCDDDYDIFVHRRLAVTAVVSTPNPGSSQWSMIQIFPAAISLGVLTARNGSGLITS